jgi:hypothetical protein
LGKKNKKMISSDSQRRFADEAERLLATLHHQPCPKRFQKKTFFEGKNRRRRRRRRR